MDKDYVIYVSNELGFLFCVADINHDRIESVWKMLQHKFPEIDGYELRVCKITKKVDWLDEPDL